MWLIQKHVSHHSSCLVKIPKLFPNSWKINSKFLNEAYKDFEDLALIYFLSYHPQFCPLLPSLVQFLHMYIMLQTYKSLIPSKQNTLISLYICVCCPLLMECLFLESLPSCWISTQFLRFIRSITSQNIRQIPLQWNFTALYLNCHFTCLHL